MRIQLLFMIALTTAINGKCYKTIEKIGYNEPLELNRNIIRIPCGQDREHIKIEDKYAKYILKRNEVLTQSKVVEIKPQSVVFKVSDSISFSTVGEVVAKYDGYVKVKKPNKEIKKYRIK